MAKMSIGPNGFVYAMPMVLVGSMAEGKANFMAAAFVTPVNFQPAIMGVAINHNHRTNAAIRESRQFSLNIPGRNLLVPTDYCGLASGSNEDKSALFHLYSGQLQFAPLIEECPIGIECELTNTVDLPSNTFFIGRIAGGFVDEEVMTDGRPDIKKIDPFLLTLADNGYWSIGEYLGQAWEEGKSFRKGE